LLAAPPPFGTSTREIPGVQGVTVLSVQVFCTNIIAVLDTAGWFGSIKFVE
jgi:hypothetical protein